ncbi:MAG TPA: hypothetical protein VG753_00615 [Candidatus Paceibacterota bacterium]|nr:hypothetical protein [Candidatus Paceibacterota bacterium]
MATVVERILRGSAEIDRMRQEIIQITTMLLGLLPEDFLKTMENKKVKHFEEDQGGWRLYRTDVAEVTKNPRLALNYDSWKGFEGRDRISYDSRYQNSLPARHVQRVHQSLSLLVDGMTSEYPFIAQQLKVFLEAAGE